MRRGCCTMRGCALSTPPRSSTKGCRRSRTRRGARDVELLTPNGVAGVAVVRPSAAERPVVLAALVSPDGTALVPRSGAVQRAYLRLDGRAVDDVLVVDRAAAGLELHLHGSPGVL